MTREPSEQQDIFATADSATQDAAHSLHGSRSGSGQEGSPKDTATNMPAGKEALPANSRKGSKENAPTKDNAITNDFSAISVGSLGASFRSSACLAGIMHIRGTTPGY